MVRIIILLSNTLRILWIALRGYPGQDTCIPFRDVNLLSLLSDINYEKSSGLRRYLIIFDPQTLYGVRLFYDIRISPLTSSRSSLARVSVLEPYLKLFFPKE